jgi:branched-subunit amino acid aminotransferase/4-amino-4-deoxychorismate lyase
MKPSGLPAFAPWLGVFETVKVVSGKPIFPKEHALSLKESATALGLKAPSLSVLQKGSIPPSDGRLRWIVDGEGFRSLFTEEKSKPLTSFSLGISEMRLGSKNWDARYKTLSYLTHWQARLERGAMDEVVLLNEWDEVASVSMANLFWVKKGIVYTPASECGCRSGVVRGWVQKQVKVKRGRFGLDHLCAAEEIFITNSMIGIQPVTRFQSRRLSIGRVTSSLREKWGKTIFTTKAHPPSSKHYRET